MARVIEIDVNVREVEGLTDVLARISAKQFIDVTLKATNAVAARSYETATSDMVSRVNLTPDYVKENVQLELAKPSDARTTVVASIYGSARRPATLRQFAPQQTISKVNWTNEMIAGKIGKWGKNPRKPGAMLKWMRRTGTPSKGIPVNFKGAGVSVEVTRGVRKNISKAFLLPVRSGDKMTGRMLPAIRTSTGPGSGKGDYEILYGPSPYQMLRTIAQGQRMGEFQRDLAETVLKMAEESVAKELENV